MCVRIWSVTDYTKYSKQYCDFKYFQLTVDFKYLLWCQPCHLLSNQQLWFEEVGGT